jgi:hypothetical protein
MAQIINDVVGGQRCAQMLGNVSCKATVSPAEQQAREKSLSTKTVNGDHSVDMVDEV